MSDQTKREGVDAIDDEAGPCPVERAIAVVGGKWKVLILWHLEHEQPMRFAALERALDGVSAKVLSQQLRELERDQMVSRTVYPEVPPRVEYALTALGGSFSETLAAICGWGETHIAAIPERQSAPEASSQASRKHSSQPGRAVPGERAHSASRAMAALPSTFRRSM